MEPIKNTDKKRHFIHVIVLLICMSLVYNSNSYVLIMFLFIMCYMLYNYKVEDIEKLFIEYTGYALDSKTLERDPEKELIDSELKKFREANSDLSNDELIKKLLSSKEIIFKNLGYDLEGKTDEEMANLSSKLIKTLVEQRKMSFIKQPLVDDCSSCKWKVDDSKRVKCVGNMETTVNGMKMNKLANCSPGICTTDQIKKVNIDGKEKTFVGSCNPEHLVDDKDGLNESAYQAILDAKRSES